MNTRSQLTRRSPVPSTSVGIRVADRDPPEEIPEDTASTNHDHSYSRLATDDSSQDYYIPPSGIPATMPPSGSASGSATSGSRIDVSTRSERVSSRHSGISRASIAARLASSAGSHSSHTFRGLPASVRSHASSQATIDEFEPLAESTTIDSDAEDVTLDGSLAKNSTFNSRASSRISARVTSRASSVRSSVRSEGRPQNADVSFQRIAEYIGLDHNADSEAVLAQVCQLVQVNRQRTPASRPDVVLPILPVQDITKVAVQEVRLLAVGRDDYLNPGLAVVGPLSHPPDAIFAPPGARLVNRAKPVVPTFDGVNNVAVYDFIEELQEYTAMSRYTQVEFMSRTTDYIKRQRQRMVASELLHSMACLSNM